MLKKHQKYMDLNCDLGESYGIYRLGMDEQLLEYISSANIACGFHAGDPSIIRQTVELCIQKNVAIGAHPGLPDLAGFGRRNMVITAQEAYDMVLYQIGAVAAFTQASGGQLHHVKPHGALYNMAAHHEETADAIARAVKDFDPQLLLYGLAGSQLIVAGEKAGIRCVHEVFADRTYQDDGSLTPRSQPDALIHDIDEAVNQVLAMAEEGVVTTANQKKIRLKADTVCVHGDGSQALSFVQRLHEVLCERGIEVKTISFD